MFALVHSYFCSIWRTTVAYSKLRLPVEHGHDDLIGSQTGFVGGVSCRLEASVEIG